MTLGFYYAPIFRVILGVYEEEKPKKGRKKKKVFRVEYEEEVAIAAHEDIRAKAEEILERERKRKRNKKLAMLILLEDI